MGLSIAPDKTKAIVFRSRRCSMPLAMVRVRGVEVAPRPSIIYLDIVLDEFWTFAHHFRTMCDKGRRVVSALTGIMPNLGVPQKGDGCYT